MKFLLILIFVFVFIGAIIFIATFAWNAGYFNRNKMNDPSDEVFLSFKDFETYYNLNPNRYIIEYDYDGDLKSLVMVETEYKRPKFKIKFKFFSFVRFWFWCKHINKYEDDQKMKKVLEYVQQDIDNIRKKAEKEIREAEKIAKEVGGRL